MSLFVVDVESDGPCPGKYSMVCFGAVKVQPVLFTEFYGKTKPISDNWKPDALAISGFTREDHIQFGNPFEVMVDFANWIEGNNVGGRPTFISDNPAYDWQFINYYFHKYLNGNPFGFSARRIGDFYAGLNRDWYLANKWKQFRKTTHTHNPVDDARGNAEALIEICKQFHIRLPE